MIEYMNVESSVPPPKPSLNGGLYTGEPFAPGAAYANVPVIPDVSYMIHYNLRSAKPPFDAIFQYPGGNRPGNNYQAMPGVTQTSRSHDLYGTVNRCGEKQPNCACSKCRFFKYAYL